jgi:hypothetical protein
VLPVPTLLLVPLHAHNAPLEPMLLLLVKLCALTVLPVTTVQPQVFLLILLVLLESTLPLGLLHARVVLLEPINQALDKVTAPSVQLVLSVSNPDSPLMMSASSEVTLMQEAQDALLVNLELMLLLLARQAVPLVLLGTINTLVSKSPVSFVQHAHILTALQALLIALIVPLEVALLPVVRLKMFASIQLLHQHQCLHQSHLPPSQPSCPRQLQHIYPEAGQLPYHHHHPLLYPLSYPLRHQVLPLLYHLPPLLKFHHLHLPNCHLLCLQSCPLLCLHQHPLFTLPWFPPISPLLCPLRNQHMHPLLLQRMYLFLSQQPSPL